MVDGTWYSKRRATARKRPWGRQSLRESAAEYEKLGRVAEAAKVVENTQRDLNVALMNELSALFFDIRRDVLYCDRPDSLRRRAVRTVMQAVFERFTLVWPPGDADPEEVRANS